MADQRSKKDAHGGERERWRPLEAGEEDEEGGSMAPTRLPRCVRRAPLCALPPLPAVPSSGLDSGSLDGPCLAPAPSTASLHLRCSFIPSPCSNARKEPPQLLILSRFCMPTSGVPHFSLRRVGTARNTRRQWFSLPEGKGCLYSSFAGFHQEQEGASATIFLKGGCYYWFYLSIGDQFVSRF